MGGRGHRCGDIGPGNDRDSGEQGIGDSISLDFCHFSKNNYVNVFVRENVEVIDSYIDYEKSDKISEISLNEEQTKKWPTTYTMMFPFEGKNSYKWINNIDILKTLCICTEIGECGLQPSDPSAYNYESNEQGDIGNIKKALQNYCKDYNPITDIIVEEEDEKHFYLLIRFNKDHNRAALGEVIINKISFDGPGSFRIRINKENGKIEYKQEVYDLKDQEYIDIIEKKYGGELIGFNSLFLPIAYTFQFPREEPDIKELTRLEWVVFLKETRYSFDPTVVLPDYYPKDFVDEGGLLPGEKFEYIYHKKNW